MGPRPRGERGRGGPGRHDGVSAGRVLRHAEGLGDDPEVAAVLERNRERVREQRQATRAARAAVRDALLAEPFDRAALERAFAGLREQRAQAQAAAHATVVELAEKLGPEQRRKLARRGRGRRGGRGPMAD
jgi:Spy/CpxP family protein refolding chaperone